MAHKYNCEKNGWKHMLLLPGTFGYDNLVISLYHVISNNNFDKNLIKEKTVEELSSLVHDGWSINYIYWRDNEPQIDKTFKYISPYNKLGDTRRNTCAITNFNDFPDYY